MSTSEAAFGLRARSGSREAAMRAAFDLLDTTPGIRVTRRSLVWAVEGVDELAAGFALTAGLDIAALQALAQRLQARLSPMPPLDPLPLAIDLLWAHDPGGEPSVVAVPPAGGPERPPLPDGQIWLHPDVPLRASACSPLSEVADHARDPATTRFASEYLYGIAPPLLERPQPLPPGFAAKVVVHDGGRQLRVVHRSPSDLLAAAAEALVAAPLAAQPIGPTTLLPDEAADTRVAVALAGSEAPHERMRAWLEALRSTIIAERLLVRRIAVLVDDATSISGVMFGARSSDAVRVAMPTAIVVDVDPDTGYPRAEFFAAQA